MPRPAAASRMAAAMNGGIGSVVSPMPREMILASGRDSAWARRRRAIWGLGGGVGWEGRAEEVRRVRALSFYLELSLELRKKNKRKQTHLGEQVPGLELAKVGVALDGGRGWRRFSFFVFLSFEEGRGG